MTAARRIASGADFVVTTSRASPATVMLASTVAICICTSSRGLLPIFGASGVSNTTLRKSWSPAVIRVAPPTGSAVIRYVPPASVAAVRLCLVSTCSALMVTPGKTPPDSPNRVPTAASRTCAPAQPALATTSRHTRRAFRANIVRSSPSTDTAHAGPSTQQT